MALSPRPWRVAPALRAFGLFLLVTLLLALLGRPFRSQSFYDWDAVQMALGAECFDVARHQPHPPGYPLWIALLKLTSFFEPDLNLAQILLAQAFTAAAGVAVFHLGRRLSGPLTGACAALFLLAAPSVLQGALTATTYPVDLFSSALLGWFAVRLYEGEERLAPWAAASAALCGGVRLSGVVFLLPLLAVALLRACRGKPRLQFATFLAGLAAAAVWVIPLLEASGGYTNYERISQTQYTGAFAWSSSLYGAPSASHLWMVTSVGVWYALVLAGPCLLTLLLFRAGGATRRATEERPEAKASWHRGSFYVLWLLPGLLNNFVLHAPKAGYVLISLPPLLLILAHAAARGLAGLRERARARPDFAYGAGALLAAAPGVLLFAYPHAPPARGAPSAWRDALFQDSLAHIRAADEDLREVLAVIRAVPADEACVIVFQLGFHAPNWRKLMWYVPDQPVFHVSRTVREARAHGTRETREVTLPLRARRVWWVFREASFPPALGVAFPDARRELLRPQFSLWSTELPLGALDREAMCYGNRVRFRRESTSGE
jgi:4-amino-4-deoxy-L-arabinose transferase-like glycosyltransferase